MIRTQIARGWTLGERGARALRPVNVDTGQSDVVDHIEQFYDPRRRHSTLGHPSAIAGSD